MKDEIKQLAIQIYMELPWYKRWQFCKWMQSNTWDVKGVMDRCIQEAKYVVEQADFKAGHIIKPKDR